MPPWPCLRPVRHVDVRDHVRVHVAATRSTCAYLCVSHGACVCACMLSHTSSSVMAIAPLCWLSDMSALPGMRQWLVQFPSRNCSTLFTTPLCTHLRYASATASAATCCICCRRAHCGGCTRHLLAPLQTCGASCSVALTLVTVGHSHEAPHGCSPRTTLQGPGADRADHHPHDAGVRQRFCVGLGGGACIGLISTPCVLLLVGLADIAVLVDTCTCI